MNTTKRAEICPVESIYKKNCFHCQPNASATQKQDQVLALGVRLLANNDLAKNGWQIRFTSEVYFLGATDHNRKVIVLSNKRLVLLPFNIIKNVILHEIAHAIVGENNGHNSIWKNTAISIGCNGEERTNIEEFQMVA